MACKIIRKKKLGCVKMCSKGGRMLFAGSAKCGSGGKGKGRRKGKGCAGLNKKTGKLKKGYTFVGLKSGTRCPKKV